MLKTEFLLSIIFLIAVEKKKEIVTDISKQGGQKKKIGKSLAIILFLFDCLI